MGDEYENLLDKTWEHKDLRIACSEYFQDFLEKKKEWLRMKNDESVDPDIVEKLRLVAEYYERAMMMLQNVCSPPSSA